MTLFGMIHPAKIAIAKALTGISRQEEIRSNQPKRFTPKKESRPLVSLTDAIQKMDATMQIAIVISTDLCLFRGRFFVAVASVRKATTTSISEIVEVMAAMQSRAKNKTLLNQEKDI